MTQQQSPARIPLGFGLRIPLAVPEIPQTNAAIARQAPPRPVTKLQLQLSPEEEITAKLNPSNNPAMVSFSSTIATTTSTVTDKFPTKNKIEWIPQNVGTKLLHLLNTGVKKNRWIISQKKLGTGTSGEVWECLDRQSPGKFAIKLMQKESSEAFFHSNV